MSYLQISPATKKTVFVNLEILPKKYLFHIDEVYLCGIVFIVKATFIKCRPVAETRKELQLSFLFFTCSKNSILAKFTWLQVFNIQSIT